MTRLIKIFSAILDIIFPITCLGCGAEGTWLCTSCLATIPINSTTTCPVCRKPATDQTCVQCQNQTPLDGLLVATSYENDLIQRLIRTYKYHSIQKISAPLAALLASYIKTIVKNETIAPLIFENSTICTSVPLHRRRLLERGFDQSALLGTHLSKQYGLPFDQRLLRRCRYTTPQAELKRTERLANVIGAFSLNKPFNYQGKNVIIIDDVATTLTTLGECAKVLKQSGARQVWGLVIARGS